MREILFRGRRKNGLEWLYGSYMEHYYSSRYGRVSAIFTNDDSMCQTYRIPVDPETVGQYTGLTDKNGKKIFEGDLISDGGMNGIPRVVRWIESSALFKCPLVRKHWAYDYNDVPLWCMQSEKTEVIGNIYDNPDLLEGGAEDA